MIKEFAFCIAILLYMLLNQVHDLELYIQINSIMNCRYDKRVCFLHSNFIVYVVESGARRPQAGARLVS